MYEFLHHPTPVIPKVYIVSPIYSHRTSHLVGFQINHHDLTGDFFQVTLFLVRNLLPYYKACGGRHSDIQMEKIWALPLNTISHHIKKDKYSLLSYIQKDSPTWLPKGAEQGWHQLTVQTGKGEVHRISTLHKELWGKWGAGGMVFPGGIYTNCLSSAK